MDKYKIIIAEDEEDIREIMALMIEGEFQYEIVEVSGGNEAINKIKDDDKIIMIMSDYNMPEGTGGDLYNYNKSTKNLPFILFTTEDIQQHPELADFNDQTHFTSLLPKPFAHEDLLKVVAQGLEHAMKSVDSKEVETVATVPSDYYRVHIDRALKHQKSYSDIFLKISDKKYLKIINQNEVIDKEQITNYKSKKIEYLYFLKDHCTQYLDLSLIHI